MEVFLRRSRTANILNEKLYKPFSSLKIKTLFSKVWLQYLKVKKLQKTKKPTKNPNTAASNKDFQSCIALSVLKSKASKFEDKKWSISELLTK